MPLDAVHPDAPLLALTHEAYAARAREVGASPTAASEQYARFHRAGALPPGDGAHPVPPPARVMESDSPEGAVRKFTLRVEGAARAGAPPARAGALPLAGAAEVALETESVIIPMQGRRGLSHTLCVSSQVGCAMGCAFCETAQMGLLRSLTPSEIVAQWWAARHHLGAEIRNLVFMGMGEPTDNLENVIQAIAVLTDRRGPAIAMSRVMVSTVGRIDGIRRLREQAARPGWKRLTLAVSVNAPNDEIRSAIMPINRSAPLHELVDAMIAWPVRSSAAICVEYVLIPGVNDRDEHADELAELLRPVRCVVNVIPYNPRRGSPWPAPEERDVARFLARLESRGQFCKRRRTKGRDSMAACGQLGNEAIRARRAVPAQPGAAT